MLLSGRHDQVHDHELLRLDEDDDDKMIAEANKKPFPCARLSQHVSTVNRV